ncbi:MAG: DEAD/DEAH box helicase [Proteobacteria bacterium]|nr:DEAD/DEAH box helicase [Pseudomonadota bacterium]
MPFAELGLSAPLISVLDKVGFKTPTDIQKRTIPVLLEKQDVMGCAQTGTGKTGAFLLPLIELLSRKRGRARMSRALILEPTRELAAQVLESFSTLSGSFKLSAGLIVGGEGASEQEKKLDQGVDVIIATPGRLLDFIGKGRLLLSDIQFLVIDEADRMLDMGFIPDIEKIVSKLPSKHVTALFSATMPPLIEKIASEFLHNPIEIRVNAPSSTAHTVTQWCVHLDLNKKKTPTATINAEKRKILRHLLSSQNIERAVIFCNRKKDVDYLSKSLKRYDFDVAALHGDMPQNKRTETLDLFRKGDVKILIASDVAARGLDIEDITHVVSFDVPFNSEDYVHRIGRTGRASRKGTSYLFVTQDDQELLKSIEALTNQKISPFKIDKVIEKEDPHKAQNSLSKKHPRKEDLGSSQHKKEIKMHENTSERSLKNSSEIKNEKIIGFGDEIPVFMKNGLPASILARLQQNDRKSQRYGEVES